MKRITVFLCVVLLLFVVSAIVGCGEKASEIVEEPTEVTESVEETKETETTAQSNNPEDTVRIFCKTVAAGDYEGAEKYCAEKSLVDTLVIPEESEEEKGYNNPNWIVIGSPYGSQEYYSPRMCVEERFASEHSRQNPSSNC